MSLDMLDKDQYEVVTSSANNIIVPAGAGSGKTRVIIERIEYLISQGVDPKSIVAITFTNHAASEMKSRLYSKESSQVFVGTIHSFANRLLKSSGESHKIITSELIQGMINSASDNLKKISHNKFKYWELDFSDVIRKLYGGQDIRKLYKNLNNRAHQIMKSMIDDSLPDTLKEILLYDLKYMLSQSPKNYYITYDEILQNSAKMLDNNKNKLRYNLLVDEFQDIGHLEYKFISSLECDTRFYVGDDWQSIYGFKGGDVKYFNQCISDPSFTRYDLEYNYRSSINIIRYAKIYINKLLSRKLIINKRVKVRSNNSGEVKVVSNLEDFIKSKITPPYSSWFILTRSNYYREYIYDELMSYGIPCTSCKKSDMTYEELQGLSNNNTVNIMTIHTAKGLESDNVLLFIPDYYAYTNDEYIGDELKVLYVGITRAKKNLYIYSKGV